MSSLLTIDGFKQSLQDTWNDMTPAQRRAARAAMATVCEVPLEVMEGSTQQPGACSTANNGRGNYTPWLNVPGCPVDCDPCAFPALDTDVRLFSWPEIDAQMWDVDTKITTLLSGSLPINAGQTATFVQEPRRTVTWIPDCVQISTTWTGGQPQPGLLTYQWATGPKNAVFPTGQVTFSNPENGQQYEAGATPTTSTTPIRNQFPTYKGCNMMAIGALSSLRLIVALHPDATSSLQSILVVCYHYKKKKGCHCGPNNRCNCG